jgi:hypothetical protein
MTFLEFIVNQAIPNELEFDCIIGDVDMPCTLCWSKTDKIGSALLAEYDELLDSPINILGNGFVEVLYDDYEEGERFCWAQAGYISEEEYRAYFGV